MAREAKLTPTLGLNPDDRSVAGFLERFARLVAAAERKACAQIVQSYMDEAYINDEGWNMARDVLNEVRARGSE